MEILDRLIDGDGRLRIGGERITASDGSGIDVLDPATAEVITAVASAGPADAADAIDAADSAAVSWSDTAPRERGEILRRAYELMVNRANEFAELIVLEMGKSFVESRGEVLYAAEFFRWFSEESVRNIGTIQLSPSGDKRILSIDQPVGVSLLITPWNFPAAMVTRKIGPALAAGCTMILKPASDTPLTALAMTDLLSEAGLPDGVVNVIPSNRSSMIVPKILADPRVRKLSFTGSTEVGKILLREAGSHVVNCSMELGGNSPFIVFDDADIEAAVEGAMIAKMRNGGQSCVAANRLYVHESVRDEFSRAFVTAMEEVQLGPGMDPGVDLGPLVNFSAQQDMSEFVGSSTASGSTVAAGGRAPDSPGFFYLPTVLTEVGNDDPILSQEIFGPVAPIVTFESEDEVISMANDTVHGLASYLYTNDLTKGMRVSEAIESGMVGLNRGVFSDPAAPFGGVKQSGIGREGAHVGMLEFLETKYIAADW